MKSHRSVAEFRRVLQFLGAHELVIPDLPSQGEAARRAVDQRITALPDLIPTDRLPGLIDRADGPTAKLAVALIAVLGLGLGKQETAHLLLDDLDLPADGPDLDGTPAPVANLTARLANSQHTGPQILEHVQVPRFPPPRNDEPARLRLLSHAHLCRTSGDSVRPAEGPNGKGVKPLT